MQPRELLLLSNPETRNALDTFTKFSGNVQVAKLRANQLIEQEVDEFEVPEDVIRNAVAKPRFDEVHVQKFVERLRAEKIYGTVGSSKMNLNSETRVLESCCGPNGQRDSSLQAAKMLRSGTLLTTYPDSYTSCP